MTSRFPRRWWSIAVIVFAAVLLSACGGAAPPTSWSGLTVSGATAYLAATDHIYALDTNPDTRDLERQLWTYPPAGQNASVTFHSQPVVTADGVLYAGSDGITGRGLIVALDTTRQGAQVMQFPQADAQAQTLGSVFGGLAYDGQSVFAGTSDGHLVALDAATLNLLWTFTTTQRIWSTPVVTNGVVYATSQDHNLYALSADTGKEIWRFKANAMLAGAPTIDGDTAYVGSIDQKLYAVDLATGQMKWEYDALGWVWDGPAVFDGVLYFGDMKGHVYAIDRDRKPVWSQPMTLEGAIRAQPLVTESQIFVVTQARKVYAINRNTQVQEWTFTTQQDGEALLTAPVLANDLLLVAPIPSGGSPTRLYALDPRSGNLEWQFHIKQQ